jgi:hypothetical protein
VGLVASHENSVRLVPSPKFQFKNEGLGMQKIGGMMQICGNVLVLVNVTGCPAQMVAGLYVKLAIAPSFIPTECVAVWTQVPLVTVTE